jgi:hypothetical protein
MSVLFTQVIDLDDGPTRESYIDLPDDIEALAASFIAAGGWYESRVGEEDEQSSVLLTHVLLTARVGKERREIAAESCVNAPEAVADAVVSLIRKSADWAKGKPIAFIAPGTIVAIKDTDTRGVVMGDDILNLFFDDEKEVTIMMEDGTFAPSVPLGDLIIIGPEAAKADLFECGGGKGAECCIFLTVGALGPECARRGPAYLDLVSREDMGAKRRPARIFPRCQDPSDGMPIDE